MTQQEKAKVIVEKVSSYLVQAAQGADTEALYDQIVADVVELLDEVE